MEFIEDMGYNQRVLILIMLEGGFCSKVSNHVLGD